MGLGENGEDCYWVWGFLGEENILELIVVMIA